MLDGNPNLPPLVRENPELQKQAIDGIVEFVMELVKEKLIKLVQAQEFGPIHVSLGGQNDSPNQELAL